MSEEKKASVAELFGKFMGLLFVGAITGTLRAYVLVYGWNHIVTKVLPMPNLSLLQVYGLGLVIFLLISNDTILKNTIETLTTIKEGGSIITVKNVTSNILYLLSFLGIFHIIAFYL